jgi:Raf kinase inhibitor-like YbhB/YbcL family protein
MNAWGLSWCAVVWMALGGWAAAQSSFQISSPDFAPGQPMPAKYTRGHGNTSPALRIKGTPAQAKSLALIVEDPDAPAPHFTHWLVWNIDPHNVHFLEGRPPRGAKVGKNSFGSVRYDGPAPPSGTHRYVFDLYALDAPLTLAAGADRAALMTAMQGHVVGKAEMLGTYSR